MDNKNKDPSFSKATKTKELLNGVFTRIDRTISSKAEFIRNNNGDVTATAAAEEVLQNTIHDVVSNTRGADNNGVNAYEKSFIDLDKPVNTILKNAQRRSLQTLQAGIRTHSKTTNTDAINHQKQHPDYSTNPTITTTALAHSLWSYVIRPGIDIAIDATAGNGYDSAVIAKLLFPQYILPVAEDENPNDTTILDPTSSVVDASATTTTNTQSMLYAIDIQLTACQNTTKRLSSILPSNIMSHNVQIWHTSHETLPSTANNNVALIVYNLGFLPGLNSQMNNKSITTKTETTITSIGNAVSLLRIGGMLSVTTYPRTNHQEDCFVHIFMETLALFSSQTQSWIKYLQHVPLLYIRHEEDDNDDQNEYDDTMLRDHLIQTLQQVYDDNPHQKWRVTQHKKLGRIDAPILLTAVRIQ